MKARVSKLAIELRVERLNKALGRPLKPWRTEASPPMKCEPGWRANEGNFHIDHQLGGYRIEEMCKGGGAHSPFGSARMSRNALCDHLEAILVAIKLARGEKDGGAWPKVEGE